MATKKNAAKPAHWQERCQLAAALRWAVRLELDDGLHNYMSLSVGDDRQMLMNPRQRHFSLIRASDIVLVNADASEPGENPAMPETGAQRFHAKLHRSSAKADCIIHARPTYATILSALSDSQLKPIDQTTASFFERHITAENYPNLSLEGAAERCALLMANPIYKVLVMENHGILVFGSSVADALYRLFRFERGARSYICALQTGFPLSVMSRNVAENTARQMEAYTDAAEKFFADLVAILDNEKDSYAS